MAQSIRPSLGELLASDAVEEELELEKREVAQKEG